LDVGAPSEDFEELPDPSTWQMFRWDGSAWEELESGYDEGENIFWAEFEDLSVFAILEVDEDEMPDTGAGSYLHLIALGILAALSGVLILRFRPARSQ